jgi:hypothetical protein
MIRVLGNLRELAQDTGAAIVLVHHQRKATKNHGRTGETLRGHSSIEAAIDLALLVEREEHSNRATMQSTKTRGNDVYPFGVEWEYTHIPGTNELYTAHFVGREIVDLSMRIEQAVLEIVETDPGMTKGTLVDAVREVVTDAAINRIRNQIKAMVEDGALEIRQGGRTGTAHCYYAPEDF